MEEVSRQRVWQRKQVDMMKCPHCGKEPAPGYIRCWGFYPEVVRRKYEESKWRKKIREILRRAEKYAWARHGVVVRHNERAWWWKRWQDEYHGRVLELIRLADL